MGSPVWRRDGVLTTPKILPGPQVAGLKKGDIIIEINGANVTRENHSQIVARIKASGDSTLFLVADKECKDYHHREGIVITSSLPNVIHLSSKRSFPVREETGEEREAPPPPPAAEESSYYSSEEEEVPETVSQKVAAPPPVPAQETKPTQPPVDTPSSSSEEEEEEE